MHCRNLRHETKKFIVESREVHIKHLPDISVVKDWNIKHAIKTKSRLCPREFATYKDQTVFAAASGVNNTS